MPQQSAKDTEATCLALEAQKLVLYCCLNPLTDRFLLHATSVDYTETASSLVFSQRLIHKQFTNPFSCISADRLATLVCHGCPFETEQQSTETLAPPTIKKFTWKL